MRVFYNLNEYSKFNLKVQINLLITTIYSYSKMIPKDIISITNLKNRKRNQMLFKF